MKSFYTLCALMLLVVAADVTSAFQQKPIQNANQVFPQVHSKSASPVTAMVTAALTIILTTTAPALASPTAAQISVDSIPPTTISVQIGDLPVVGSLLSGTYTKVDSATSSSLPPSVIIKSPTDKIKAIQTLASSGHLEFDIAGKTGIKTHLDVDVAADEPGVANVRVASNLIPKLPFKNAASTVTAKGGRESQWSIVTNLGNGESYYFNAKTGETSFEKPAKI
jgi:hypothetical protein